MGEKDKDKKGVAGPNHYVKAYILLHQAYRRKHPDAKDMESFNTALDTLFSSAAEAQALPDDSIVWGT